MEAQSLEAVTLYRKCLQEVRIISGEQKREQEVINENFEDQIRRIYNQMKDPGLLRRDHR